MRRLALLGVMLVATRASADATTADRAAADADKLAAAGDFAGAAARFHAAYLADPRPDLICNVGVAYQKANDLPRAHRFLTDCLLHETRLDPKFVDAVHANLTAIEASLRAGAYTPFDIEIEPASATVAVADYPADEAFVGGREIWLPAGPHRVAIRAEGYAAQTVDVVAQGKDVVPIRVTLARATAPVVEPPRPPPRGERHPTRLVYATGAITIAAIGVGALAFTLGRRDADRAHFALTPDAFASDQHAVDTWNSALAISGLVAIVGATASTYLYVRAHQTRAEVVLLDRGGGLRVTGSF